MIPHGSTLRMRWDLGILLLILITCLIVPYQIAFLHEVDLLGSIIIYTIDLVFICDILLNFRTTFRRQGVEITDRSQITRRYRRSLLTLDVLAAVPFDVLLLGVRDFEVYGVSIVLLVRMLRLLRIVRLFSILRGWETHSWTNVGFLRIVRLFLTVVLLLHWIASAWFLVSYMAGFPTDSWPAIAGIVDASPSSQYVRSLYWSVVTMTAVGYGDITPSRDAGYGFTIVVILIGASLWAYIIANIASLISNVDSGKAAFWNQVEVVNQYLRSREVPPQLNEHVRSYYEYVWDRYRGMSERSLLSDLPAPVRLEVLLHLTRDLIEKVPLFSHCDPPLRNALLMALEPRVFAPGGYVVREGEVGNEIHFVSRGTMEITSEGGERSHGTLESGDYFGDLSLLLGERRTASVRASTHCDVFALTRDDFDRIRTDYPEFRNVLKTISSEKSDRLSALVLDGVVL